jgi:hypothetical protein
MSEIRSAAKGARGRASADRRARGVRDRGGLAPGDTGADRRARGAGHMCAKRYPRSGSCDQDRTEGIRPGRRGRTAAGGAAHLRGGEVARFEAGTS